MNWSTRLRRWVRISTPPVREASMKPTAATVLPAPVACSNQNLRSAPGSSGASCDQILVGLGGGLLPVLRLLVVGKLLALRRQLLAFDFEVVVEQVGTVVDVLVVVDGGNRLGAGLDLDRGALVAVGLRLAVAAVLPGFALRAFQLRGHRGESPGKRVDLVVVELGAVEKLRLVLRQQALEPKQQGVVAAPLHRWRLGAVADLRESRLNRAQAGGARDEVGESLAFEQDRLTGEIPHLIEFSFAQLAGRFRSNVSVIGHGKGGCDPVLA